jgi:hypothetical protein
MAVGGDNCKGCPDFTENKCDGKTEDCICRRCPRNLGKCITTKYCTETESILYI